MTGVTITGFKPELAPNFAVLNLAWINQFFEVEPGDEKVLRNPFEEIIEKGGHIFFALAGSEVVGTVALIKLPGNVYELGKMAVAHTWQGKQVGAAMLAYCINKARQWQVQKLVLYSNTILQPAIHLYKKFGFVEVPMDESLYKRSNIKMELEINKEPHDQDRRTV